MARRPPPYPTEPWLRALAAAYVDRFAPTEATVRRHLRRRLNDAVRAHPIPDDERAALDRASDAIVGRLRELRMIDDRAWAESRARALRRRGASGGAVRRTLSAKGVADGIAAEVLREEPEGAELDAARAWARKHHLGPWRRGPADPEVRRKELARLARRGFGYALAVQVVDADPA